MSVAANVTFTPNSTQFSIMKLVHGYLKKYKKAWNLMSQEWILARLKQFYGVVISRSALNYNLAILREQKIIETVKRHKRDEVTGAFICQVTLYKMTSGLRRFFSDIAVYFKRCEWTPSKKQMAMGIHGVVGAVTSREDAHRETLADRRRKPVQPRRKKR
jgi:hypothetical protein